jgi:transcriptional regulator with XRE-family HTH domain
MGDDAVFSIPNISKKLFERLQRKSFRRAYLAEHIRRGIAYQIRALRDQREWKQGRFAKLLGKPQSVVSRLEDPSYGKLTVQTLLEVANVFDVALQIRFVSYSSFLQNTRDVSTASMEVPSFDDDSAVSAPALGQIIVPTAKTALANADIAPRRYRVFSSQFTGEYSIDLFDSLRVDPQQVDDTSQLDNLLPEKYENWFGTILNSATPSVHNRNLTIKEVRLHG